jgi:ABC-type antimicrobial peptide transport system permease subunit
MSRSLGQRRFTMLLLGLLAGVALVLASIGVHGVLSHAVAERHREIGIRMALGARSRDLVSLVVGNGLALTAIGLTLGLAGAAALTRFLRAQLFTVTPTDPTSFAAVACLLGLVALVATAGPARRATLVDPIVSLRNE